jgi:hypothetical protein
MGKLTDDNLKRKLYEKQLGYGGTFTTSRLAV